MLELIVAAVILIIIMLVFVFFLFKNILKRMDDNAKRYFVNKMQDYDYIVEEKREELNNIKSEIQELEKENKNIISKKEDEFKIPQKKNNNEGNDFIEVQYELKTPKFREEDFFKNYKELKRIFTVDNENLIKKFVKEHKNEKEEKEYNSLNKIRNKFDENAVYECLTLNKNEQLQVIQEVLTATDKKTLKLDKILEEKKDFGIEDLIKLIDDRIEKVDPYIYIYMNVIDKNYGKIDKNIILKQYNNMSEGMIIKFRNKIYDYSI